MKLVTIIGARPQFIKAAVVSREIRRYKNNIREILIHTGQHFDKNMSEVFFEELDIPIPDYNLGVGGGTHGQNTGRMIEKIEGVLLEEYPDCVLVYGDTDSTLAGALAAAKLHIPVAHVEAGLRSFNKKMPEEINRVLTDNVSNILFCPTEKAVANLKAEGFDNRVCKISNVGDVMYDAAMYYADRSTKPTMLNEDIGQFVLATIHRAENTDNIGRLTEIVAALNELAETIQVVLPLHHRTKKSIEQVGLKLNVNILDPVSYFEMIWLLQNCKLVLTDSGGLQKEAFFFKKHCMTLRDQTEWVELVDAGVNTLVDVEKSKILDSAISGLNHKDLDFPKKHFYGNSDAAKKIVKYLANY